MTNEVKVLSDDEVAEVAAMFPHAEYQPTLNADQVDPCHFCKGTIDDHKANCVVPHVPAICATIRALRAEREKAIGLLSPNTPRTDLCDAARQIVFAHAPEKGNAEKLQETNTALREQLAQKDMEISSRLADIDTLQSRLAQVTQGGNE